MCFVQTWVLFSEQSSNLWDYAANRCVGRGSSFLPRVRALETSHGFVCLCFLNISEGETLKLYFELLLRWNRLGREVVRVTELCPCWT